jgi:hypothetical protein
VDAVIAAVEAKTIVIARSEATKQSSFFLVVLDCFASLAMTVVRGLALASARR